MKFFKKLINLFHPKKDPEINSDYSGTLIRESFNNVLPVIEVKESEFKSDPTQVLKRCLPYEYWSDPRIQDWLVNEDNSIEAYEQFFKDVHINFDRANHEISIIDTEKFQFGGHWLIFKYTVKDNKMFIEYWGLEG